MQDSVFFFIIRENHILSKIHGHMMYDTLSYLHVNVYKVQVISNYRIRIRFEKIYSIRCVSGDRLNSD